MKTALLNFSKIFWPELEDMVLPRQLVGIGDVITSIYSTILFIAGLSWLVLVTDIQLILDNWPTLLFLALLILLFTKLNFFMIIEFRADRYGSTDGAFNSMMVWTAALIFGHSALWLMILLKIAEFVSVLRRPQSKSSKWNNYRNLALNLAGFTIPYIIGLETYSALGGALPLTALDQQALIAGFTGIIINFIVFTLIWTPYFLYVLQTQKLLAGDTQTQPILTFFAMAITLPTLAHPFAILAASLYSTNGFLVFIFFITGLVVVAYLARQFSWTAEFNRQQTRQLEKLEQLGRAILNAPPDGSMLVEILDQHTPNMFPASNIAIWTGLDQLLYKAPEDWDFELLPVWDWAKDLSEARAFQANEGLPWDSANSTHRPTVVCPIIAFEGTEIIGGIIIELRLLAQPWDRPALERLFPAVHSLTDQIASAIYQAEEYVNSIALQKVSQEIQLAGQIQASFLPNQIPNIPGWQLAVTLEPAGGLSGDFFDFLPLSRGRLGIIIADVADKGLGAALYMALGRTLLRTYAFEYHSRPDIVFNETNERILMDARANLFITCFYGVLDPENGTLTYCNAGHNPPYWIKSSNSTKPIPLARTGMPIGIDTDATWERYTISFDPGDNLIMYTDGVTEAQNEEEEFFDESLLLESATQTPSANAFEIQASILSRLRDFVGTAPRFDDITLMVLSKDKEPPSTD